MNQNMFKFDLRDILGGFSFLIILILLYCFTVLVAIKWGIASIPAVTVVFFVYIILNELMAWCFKKQVMPHLVIFLFWVFVCLFDVVMGDAPLDNLIQTISFSCIINIVFLRVFQILITKFMKVLRAERARVKI